MLCRDTDAADLLSTTNSLFQLKNMIIRNKKEGGTVLMGIH